MTRVFEHDDASSHQGQHKPAVHVMCPIMYVLHNDIVVFLFFWLVRPAPPSFSFSFFLCVCVCVCVSNRKMFHRGSGVLHTVFSNCGPCPWISTDDEIAPLKLTSYRGREAFTGYARLAGLGVRNIQLVVSDWYGYSCNNATAACKVRSPPRSLLSLHPCTLHLYTGILSLHPCTLHLYTVFLESTVSLPFIMVACCCFLVCVYFLGDGVVDWCLGWALACIHGLRPRRRRHLLFMVC